VNNKQITRKQTEDKNSQSSQSAENNLQQEKKQSQSTSYFPNGEKVAIDYTKKQIGIDQVLKDFRNTTNAIGAPDEVKSEVSSYLSLIESQSQKDNPNAQIIQSNLKNASQILDEYITNTLKKPSKVVENWVDTLFLQQINYKTDKQEEVPQEEITQDEQPQIIVEQEEPQKTQIEEQTETPVLQGSVKEDVYIPDDPQLKRLFIQAKKYAAIDNKEKALYSFQNTMDYAEEIGDVQTGALIHYEEGKLYDEFNQLDDALYNYDRASKLSTNNNVKAKANLAMGKIYDDYVNFEPALDHYCAAVSYAGEADNLKLQTQALSNLAQLHTNRYDKENAFMFMNMAQTIAEETDEEKVKGITYSKNAKMTEKLGEKAKALTTYANASSCFSEIEDYENLAKNYKSAAEIMLQYGNSAKATKLLSKAYVAAQKPDNSELKKQITDELAQI
jgi:tetratricopeptide (TPR) repeat protein